MKAFILGAGTYGEVYASYLYEAGIKIAGFLDDNKLLHGKSINNLPIVGDIEYLKQIANPEHYAVYCPIGNNAVRVKLLSLARSLGFNTPNFIHQSVLVSPNVNIAKEGVYILPNVTIMPYTTIEKDVMISVGANIIHHSFISQGTFISNGVNLGANIKVENCSYIGMGATIMTGVKRLGNNCLIGAGAVVIKDVDDNTIVAGVPAKVIKYK